MDEEKKVLDTEIVVSMSNATYKGEVGPQGPQGEPGLSAYLVAVDNGFVGSQQEWLATLKGEQGERGLTGPKGDPGDSAYQVAVNNGFEGTEEEWLASIHTMIEGDAGKSAYEIAVDNGFEGTETEWLASLKGIKGDTGATGPQGETGPAGQDGATPVKGVDYFTQADINSIVAQVPSPDLSSYATKAYLEQVVRGIETGMLKRSVVQALPIEDIDENTIYMVPKIGSTGDVYNEYLYVNNTWELIGDTEVDLTNYATKNYVDGAVFSGDYNDLTNKPTIPSEYTLPTATTSSLGGVKVDGSTITINDGVISAAVSGSSYTAGDGIDIDSNNVIDLLDNRTSLVPILYSILTRNTGMARQEGSIQVFWNNRFSRANLTYHIDNLKTWRMTYFSDGLVVATWRALVEALEGPIDDLNSAVSYRFPGTQQADQYTYIMAQASATLADNSRFNMANQPVLVEYIPDATVKWVFISYPERLFQNIYFNSQQGLTSHSIAAAIDEVAGQVGTKFTAPTAPTTDGAYKLTTTVTSGTATNAWVSDSGGGSSSSSSPTIIDIKSGLITADSISNRNAIVNNTTKRNTLKAAVEPYLSDLWAAAQLGVGNWRASYQIFIDGAEVYYIKQNMWNTNTYDFYMLVPNNNDISVARMVPFHYEISFANNGTEFDTSVFGGGLTTSTNGTEAYAATTESVYASQIFAWNHYNLYQELQYINTNFARKTDITAVVPDAPTTDGDYVLKVSVSSGTPTYSWVAAT